MNLHFAADDPCIEWVFEGSNFGLPTQSAAQARLMMHILETQGLEGLLTSYRGQARQQGETYRFLLPCKGRLTFDWVEGSILNVRIEE